MEQTEISKSRVLITGASGALGIYVVKKILNEGQNFKVRAFCRNEESEKKFISCFSEEEIA